MVTWKDKDVPGASDMSRNDRATEKASEKRSDAGSRGGWWLRTLKDTPIPGHYHIRDFLEEAELNPVKKTYSFKSQGRRAPPQSQQGDLLLPGAYSYIDSTQKALARQASWSFQTCPRPDIFTLGIRDKDLTTSPCHYNVTEKPVDKIPCTHVMFRSTAQRILFLPKEGPAPCKYDLHTRPAKGITSCFKSTLPRLHGVTSKTPGPGAYQPSWKMGSYHLGTEAMTGQENHGLFFRMFSANPTLDPQCPSPWLTDRPILP